MPLKPDHKRLQIPMTAAQKSAVDREAERLGIGRTELVRSILAQYIPGFPDDMPRRGTYKRDVESERK